MIKFVHDFGKRYGYVFEHEATYDRICLVNNAVYIAKYATGKHAGEWVAVGAEFAHPFVFKTLFSHEAIQLADYAEVKSVTAKLYLDMNEKLPDVSSYEEELVRRHKKTDDEQKRRKKVDPALSSINEDELLALIANGHNYQHIGSIGSFVPVKPNYGGGILVRYDDNKYSAAVGSKGFRWLEFNKIKDLPEFLEIIDMSYYRKLIDSAYAHISKFGDVQQFLND
jgi:hypothetical protein